MSKPGMRWKKIDGRILDIEKTVIAIFFLLMSGAVFIDVVHRVFSRTPGRLSFLLSSLLARFGTVVAPAHLDRLVSPLIIFFVGVLICVIAVSTSSKEKSFSVKSVLKGAGAMLVLTLVVQAVVRFIPYGFVWSPYFGLIGFLWIGLLGASGATSLHQHLQLEMGEKLWPKKFLPHVLKVNRGLSALFCLGLAILAAHSVIDHFQDWSSAGGSAGLIPSLGWPKWIVYLVIPYAFSMMSVRFALGGAKE